MFSHLYDKATRNIDVVVELIDEHQWLSDISKNTVKRKDLKVFSIASSITRLYAIYESYIETILSDYLDALSDLVPFQELPAGFKNEYRLGISHILSRIDQGRYKHLDHENVVNRYHGALNGAEHYQFVTDALIRHEQNLRLNIVENMFSKLGLDNFESWLLKHPLILEFFNQESVGKETLESKIKNFIDLRNDASHGEIDNLVNAESLKDYCKFISVLMEVVRQYLSSKLLDVMNDKGKVAELGKVSESFGQSGAFVLKGIKGTSIEVNNQIFITGKNSFKSLSIESIQIDSASREEIVVDDDDTEIGLKCASRVRKNVQVFKQI